MIPELRDELNISLVRTQVGLRGNWGEFLFGAQTLRRRVLWHGSPVMILTK